LRVFSQFSSLKVKQAAFVYYVLFLLLNKLTFIDVFHHQTSFSYRGRN